MNTIILPMAYRRSVRRSSLAERTLPKMKDVIDPPIKPETGELVTHRLPVLLSSNNNTILAHSNNLSNRFSSL